MRHSMAGTRFGMCVARARLDKTKYDGNAVWDVHGEGMA